MRDEGIKAANLKFAVITGDNVFDLVGKVKSYLDQSDQKILDISFLQDKDGSFTAVIIWTI